MATSNRVSFLDEHMENYNIENSALLRKLQSKTDALKILRKEIEQFRTERDQFKLMAETLQFRYSAMKKSIDTVNPGYMDINSTTRIMNEMREKNLNLSTELEKTKERLKEKEQDIQVLREQNAINIQKNSTDSHQDSLEEERNNMITKLETLKKKNTQLQFDFRTILDEKEELITERDAYKCKAHRLNHELNVVLKSNSSQKQVLDVDALILENKFLQERVKSLETEIDLAKQNTSKYRAMLDTKKKPGSIKLGSKQNSNLILSHRQVRNILESDSLADLPSNEETIADLKALCLNLLDSLNDKSTSLQHQKKANKILASRITELESRLQQAISSEGASPSQILLSGYHSSEVDEIKVPIEIHQTNDQTKESSEVDEESILSESSLENSSNPDIEKLPPDLAKMVQDALKYESHTEDEEPESSNTNHCN